MKEKRGKNEGKDEACIYIYIYIYNPKYFEKETKTTGKKKRRFKIWFKISEIKERKINKS